MGESPPPTHPPFTNPETLRLCTRTAWLHYQSQFEILRNPENSQKPDNAQASVHFHAISRASNTPSHSSLLTPLPFTLTFSCLVSSAPLPGDLSTHGFPVTRPSHFPQALLVHLSPQPPPPADFLLPASRNSLGCAGDWLAQRGATQVESGLRLIRFHPPGGCWWLPVPRHWLCHQMPFLTSP